MDPIADFDSVKAYSEKYWEVSDIMESYRKTIEKTLGGPVILGQWWNYEIQRAFRATSGKGKYENREAISFRTVTNSGNYNGSSCVRTERTVFVPRSIFESGLPAIVAYLEQVMNGTI